MASERYIKKDRICPECGSIYQATDFDIDRGKYKKCKACSRKKQDKYIQKIRYCSEHGEFMMNDFDIERGRGCPKCGRKRTMEAKLGYIPEIPEFVWEDLDPSEIERVKNREFKPAVDKLKWICPKHGVYEMLFTNHVYMKQGIRRCGCPKCVSGGFRSKMELEIEGFCVQQGWKLGPRRGILPNRMEIDIYLPEFNVGIEVDGKAWHTEGTYDLYGRYIPIGYHENKDREARSLGIDILHITDSEWWVNGKNTKTKQKIINFIEEHKPKEVTNE